MEKKNEPEKIETRGLLLGAAGAFGAGLMGAIWHTKRKQAKEAASEAAAAAKLGTTTPVNTSIPTSSTPVTSVPPSSTLQNSTSIPEYKPPKMTPEQYAVAKKDARFFAFKALGYGTLLALGGASVLAVGVGYWLDVRNFKEFSDKLKEIVPRQTSRLRAFLGGKELVMRPEEQEEWDRAVANDE
ncbi:hypothetical protein BDA99DRAFT_569196 [Phascolomyces articulosus]|uniref:Transmembrane protein 242 n=1 Tax=Phascolomyces articulosus TaxID=60185 RepID=A0AAD5KJS3_9FUNG|nr:hypothetical protein BDA99DRAFT_569196 [Phascolomyces articulosus]